MLPIRSVAAVLFCLSLVELVLLPQASPPARVVAVHVVVLGTLLALPRRPLLVLVLLLGELFLVKELRINEMVSVSLSLLGPFAAFATAALVPPKRLPWVALALAAHLAWRATLPSGDTATMVVTTALLAAAASAGALLHRRRARLDALLAERDALLATLAGGPADAATAEQLRMWSEIEQRIEPVIAQLPRLVARAAAAPSEATVEAVRVQATDALAEMQATVRALGEDRPATFEAPIVERLTSVIEANPPRRRLPTLDPLRLACALLLAGVVAELIVLDAPGPWALVLPLFPLLAPRRPITAALGLAAAVVGLSAAGGLAAYATTQDFVASLTLLVVGAVAPPRRAVAGLAIVAAGMCLALAAEDMGWPTISYVSLVLVLVASWGGGVLLRGVAAQQRHVGAALAEAAEALETLERRAVQRERVRLAHELHDLVGHALTAVAIQAGAVKAHLRRGREPEFGPLEAVADEGVSELRRLAAVLGREPQAGASVAAELERIAATARASGQDVALELDAPLEDVDPRVRHTVVCVTAEALTNAAKHASGAPVRVRLGRDGHGLALDVTDDGGASEGLPSGGRGTTSMAQRVRACGGTFSSGPRPGGGWKVQAQLPLSV